MRDIAYPCVLMLHGGGGSGKITPPQKRKEHNFTQATKENTLATNSSSRWPVARLASTGEVI